MRNFIVGLGFSLLFAASAVMLPAQWIKIKTPGLPRKADGKLELAAAAPRLADGKPDLSGLWGTEDNTYVVNITSDLKPEETRPWADAVYRKRLDALDRDTPATRCLPGGPSEILSGQYRIVQQPNVIAILYGGGAYRQIFMDGRELPKDPNPTWWGYSVGHWEGDTLVVQSAGFNDRSWLDFAGHPHTEDLRVTERFQRRDFGRMQLQVTVDDPKTFARPFTITLGVNFVPDTEMLEYVCNENEKDAAHLVGNASDDVKSAVKVSSELLTGYAGTYVMDNGRMKMQAVLSVVNGELMFSFGGRGAVPLTALSDTAFYFPGGFPVDIVNGEKGKPVRLVLTAPGDVMEFVRTR